MEHTALIEDISRLRKAFSILSTSSSSSRNALLLAIARQLEADKETLFAANAQDMEAATASGENLGALKRLKLNQDKLAAALQGIHQVAKLPDPINTVRERRLLDDGLLLEKVSFPIGVIGMIFEARPDALIQIVALCLKSGNGIILKGGKEAIRSNRAIVQSIRKACEGSVLGSEWMLLVETHADVDQMLQMDGYIDLLIPRGTNAFVRYVMDHTSIPVLGHSDGICAIYVDSQADLQKAIPICVDAKINYPAACNSVETILVNEAVAQEFLPALKQAMDAQHVVIHGDGKTVKIIGCQEATDEDFDTEYLGLEVAVKVVGSLKEATDHIAEHGSHHTDCILTENDATARRFLRDVDSADVFWNCSTRFADGFRYGLGAELGVSTTKIHARGPVGIEGLMTTKWLLKGNGQIVGDYMGANARSFRHIDLPKTGDSLAGNFEEEGNGKA